MVLTYGMVWVQVVVQELQLLLDSCRIWNWGYVWGCPAHLSILPRPPVYMYISTVYCVDQCSPATLPTVYNLYLEAALIGESYYTVICSLEVKLTVHVFLLIIYYFSTLKFYWMLYVTLCCLCTLSITMMRLFLYIVKHKLVYNTTKLY